MTLNPMKISNPYTICYQLLGMPYTIAYGLITQEGQQRLKWHLVIGDLYINQRLNF